MGEIFAWAKPRNALEFTGERWTSAASGQIEVEHLHRYLAARDLCRDKDVLDVACGEGYGSALLAQVARRVVGIDFARTAIAHAADEYAGPNLHYVAADARHIPLAAGCIDVAVSFETLEHFAEQERFLAELRRLLRPDGLLILSTPDSDVYSPIGGPANPYHVRELSRDEFVAELAAQFSHVAILGQRPLLGSAIVPRAATTGTAEPVTYERRDDTHFERSSGLPRALYLIACASNRPLTQALGPSLYIHGSQVDGVMQAGQQEVRASLQAAEAELNQLRAAREAGEAELRETNIKLGFLQGELQENTENMRKMQGDLEARQAELQKARSALKSAQAELAYAAATERTVADLREQNSRLGQNLAACVSRLRGIEDSTSWRATAALRSTASRLPKQVRFNLRRGAKAAYWMLTPQRMPHRVRFLRDRRKAARQHAGFAQSVAAADDAHLSLAEPIVAKILQHFEPVDIIICVHNALDDVRQCLAAVLQNTLQPYRMILVDDGSAAPTRDYLQDFARAHNAILLRNEQALGYAAAANCGMRASKAPWLVLLNSDTIVTRSWLDAMWSHGQRDAQIGVIGPLSNAASWQSVPKVADGDDWAKNQLPSGMTLEDMADIVRSSAVGARAMPFLNGFCYMIRRRLIDHIGMFDQTAFGNYGEENDFSIRTRRAGYKLVVATDAYVFHAGSKSYSLARRRELEHRANAALAAKHDPAVEIEPYVQYCRSSLVFTSVRARVQGAMRRRGYIARGRGDYAGKRVAFVLPVSSYGGGANVIFQESAALIAMGVDVSILNFSEYAEVLAKNGLPKGIRFLSFADEAALRTHIDRPPTPYDAVVATYFKSVYWLPKKPPAGTVFGYYIQDFEPRFFDEADPEHGLAKASYASKAEMKLFTKTLWTQRAVADATGRVPAVIGCSTNVDLFSPAEERALSPSDRPLRIAAMLRPSSLYRGPHRTVAVIEEVIQRNPGRVAVHAFGATDEDLAASGLARPWIINYGLLSPRQVSRLLSFTDIFVDLSDYQAMGLTLLEAMASGCAVIGPIEGGANSFVRDTVSGLLADTASQTDCIEKICLLITDAALRMGLQRNAIEDANTHVPEIAAVNMLNALFS